jgi:hypothetical protein
MKLERFSDFVENRNINEDLEPIENPNELTPELNTGKKGLKKLRS